MSIVSNLILIILLCTLGVASRVFLTLAVYYDAKGASYRFSSDDFCYKDDDGNAYASLQCFLDENGYFYFDKENKLTYDSEIKKYKDPESEKTYIPIMGVYWDAQGNMQSTY